MEEPGTEYSHPRHTLRQWLEPGVHIIEGPMGYGKTEPALAAAYQLIAQGTASGLYFG